MGLLSRFILAGLVVGTGATSLFGARPRGRRRAGEPQLEEQYLVTGDGARLPISRWPAAYPTGSVLGLHAFADYRHGLHSIGTFLGDADFDVFAYDQRGFGETSERGRWVGIDTLIDDLADAAAALMAADLERPLVILGESFGGSIALAAALRGRLTGVAGLVLAAPGYRGDLPPAETHDLALRFGSMALPWQPEEIRRGGRPWLHPGEATRIADDPLMLRGLDKAFHRGLVEALDAASAPARAHTLPTLILHGALDTVIGSTLIDELTEALGPTATLRRYPDHHHLLLHERGAEDVLSDIAAWIRDRKEPEGANLPTS